MNPLLKPSLDHRAESFSTENVAPARPVPTWLRQSADRSQTVEDAAVVLGAAIDALDAVVRRQERWAGAWRQRLAVTAAAATAKQVGRLENEAALRDTVLLMRPGDDAGPAGRILLAWRRFAASPVDQLLTKTSIAAVLDELGLAGTDEVANNLAANLQQLSTGDGLIGVLSGAFASARHQGCWRHLGPWFAGALLAQKLGWQHAVPLREAHIVSVTCVCGGRYQAAVKCDRGPLVDKERMTGLLLAQAQAALQAIDLSIELGKRAERLIAVAPKLRAKGAALVVEKLLSDDAIIASTKIAGMSDRAVRRLFDRLVDLGAVRELSGRTTFRTYGL